MTCGSTQAAMFHFLLLCTLRTRPRPGGRGSGSIMYIDLSLLKKTFTCRFFLFLPPEKKKKKKSHPVVKSPDVKEAKSGEGGEGAGGGLL